MTSTHPRVRWAPLLGLSVALVLLVLPSSASAFQKAIWGTPYQNGVNQFPIYRQLGVKLVEMDLNWFTVAVKRPHQATDPRDPAYQWPAAIGQAVTLARRYHMSLLLQIIGTPRWANGGRPWNWVPHNPQDFALFATAAARKYPSIHMWMVWGEPSRSPNFMPEYPASVTQTTLTQKQQIAPHNYALLLDDAYGALKAVSTRNIVIGGCTYTTGDIDTRLWIANLKLPNGKAPRMDMYAHNPFTFSDPALHGPPPPPGEVNFDNLTQLAGWIDTYLKRGMPIFLSEWTIPTAADQEFNAYVTASVAAQWIHDALALCRRYHRIYGLGWIHVYDAPPVSFGGLFTVDGIKKPLFTAFSR